jgi:hypothetical protein
VLFYKFSGNEFAKINKNYQVARSYQAAKLYQTAGTLKLKSFSKTENVSSGD